MRIIIVVCWLTIASGLPALGQLTITNPDETSPPGSVRQVSLSTPATSLPPTKAPSLGQHPQSQQLRIRVQFLEVDPTTREAIYAGLGTDTLLTSTNLPPKHSPDSNPETLSDFPLKSDSITRTTALVTQAVLNTAEVAGILKMTESSDNSIIADAPNLLLLNDTKIELTDMIQRPFVVNHEKQGDENKPILQHIDEGTRLGIIAKIESPTGSFTQQFQIGCEIVSRRVIETRIDFLFGHGSKPLKVQIPHLQVTTARATAKLASGQTLLVDPHITSTRSFRSEKSVPFLGKLPYVGRSFKNVAVTTRDQHLIVLLHPESVTEN
ncbi:MAG TPA: hypothetical protein DEF45_06585 [Rhodopirellula sp.]|nr:hypothetical protein [Rhodopirellula sp.]